MFYIKKNNEKVEIGNENVYTTCPECGKEQMIDLEELFQNESVDLNGTAVICEDCTKKRGEDEYDENYPSTQAEKISYALYVVTATLENISKAIRRMQRLEALSKLKAPNVIINCESRMALEHLKPVVKDVADATSYVLGVFLETKKEKEENHG